MLRFGWRQAGKRGGRESTMMTVGSRTELEKLDFVKYSCGVRRRKFFNLIVKLMINNFVTQTPDKVGGEVPFGKLSYALI